MAIHFKSSSIVEYDSIDDSFTLIGSLKKKTVEHKKLGRASNFDLFITNAQIVEGNYFNFS